MVLGVLALVKLGVRGSDVVIRGDSTSALSWMDKQKVSGKKAMNAALVLVSLCVQFGIEINYTVFLSGVDNFQTDRLSRMREKNMTMERAMELNEHGNARIMDLLKDPATTALCRGCDPGNSCDSEEDFQRVWVAIREALNGI
jgi:hypothetical protein